MKKHTNKLISILLVLAMLLTIVPMNMSVSAAPDTDYTGYYKITNAGNLAWFACLVAGDTSQSGITEAVPDAKAVLTADIDITVLAERLGKSWVGIGTAEIPFTGIFDGNGYTIKGLTTDTGLTKSAVATVPVDTEKQGLFGVIGEGGVVRDVIVEGTANLSDTIKYGGICSENNGTIENVLSMVTVTGGDNADIFCHTNNGTITNSFADQNSMATDVTLVTTEELADGSVTYALGDSFGQTIGTDTQPVHYDGTNRVYKDGDAYTNTAPVYAASVTDANGNELEGSPYKTFAEAVAAAEANENSTLTLLDNITLTGKQDISSGKFTLDLSGKTLLCESSHVLLIESGADLTIKDSEKNGLIETKITGGSAIQNNGTLTFESGMVKSGESAIKNEGKLKVNNGIFEGEFSIYTTPDSSAEINNGTFNGIVWGFSGYTINDGNFTSDYVGINCQGETLTINGGTFDIDEIEILRGTVELKGGQFTRGFTLNDEGFDDDEPHYLNDILADGYCFYDADGQKITVAEDATSIEGYVQVKEYFAASVTDAEGKLIGNYKTFAEAVTAAEANENSTLTLLDNITLTNTQDISSGKFTLDLSGKTLICESSYVLWIESGADLTIKDSGKNGLIETKITNGSAIQNKGTLTFESGMVKSVRHAIKNEGKLKVNNGIFEGEYSIYISSDSSTELNDGTFNGKVWGFSGYTINDGNFTSDRVGINCQGETLTINGGTFDIDEIRILQGTVELKGGQFTKGFTLKDYEDDDDEPHYLNDILADGYCFYDADGQKITVAEDATSIEGYVQVKEYFVASVTDAEGKLIGNYKTFAEAVAAAEANENSTLTLLDNITLTGKQDISSGKLTLDLSGKTLICESSHVLWIKSGADLTIKDSGKNGLIETKITNGSAIRNDGTLTFESGMVKSGESAITNEGKLKVNNGIFEGEYSIYTTQDSSTEINNGTFNGVVWGFSGYTINDGNFTSDRVGINCQGETLTINGGTFDIDEIRIHRGTVELKGGQFTRGFTLNDYEYDNDEPHYLNDILADGYYYRNAGGYLMTFNDDASVIDEPVHIRRGAKLVTQAEITLAQTEFEFTGEEIRPEVTVKIAGITLEDKDIIELVYNNNVNAGTGTVTVSSSDPYFEGEVTLEFTITPKAVDIIWSGEIYIDTGSISYEASYIDVNGNTVVLDVENGTNTAPGVYTAVTEIKDTNYVATNTSYKYIIDGDYNLSGIVTSFGNEADEVTLLLYKAGDRENSYEATVTGNSAEYAFEGIVEGEYILEVSKNNHVTRTYEVVVSEEYVTQDVKIHLLGDINGDGKLNVVDAARINAHAKGAVALIDYEFACADVNGDSKVNVIDAAVSNAHAKGVKPIW